MAELLALKVFQCLVTSSNDLFLIYTPIAITPPRRGVHRATFKVYVLSIFFHCDIRSFPAVFLYKVELGC